MRIQLDEALCQAYGNCLLAAPDSFRLEDGMAYAEVSSPNPTEQERVRVEEAVRSCPVEALILIDD